MGLKESVIRLVRRTQNSAYYGAFAGGHGESREYVLGYGDFDASVSSGPQTLAFIMSHAPVAELVDATDLKSVGRKAIPVRFRAGAPLTC